MTEEEKLIKSMYEEIHKINERKRYDSLDGFWKGIYDSAIQMQGKCFICKGVVTGRNIYEKGITLVHFKELDRESLLDYHTVKLKADLMHMSEEEYSTSEAEVFLSVYGNTINMDGYNEIPYNMYSTMYDTFEKSHRSMYDNFKLLMDGFNKKNK